ncbi:hypothetical protein IFR05_003342 [Cadophora sp. M221]|nr:hypothetical protein IFR05_003342 [Cadophora sp. M221]
MDALVANRGTLGRMYNMVSGGKTIGPGVKTKRIPLPKPSSNQIVVKINSVALNPIDYKSADLLSSCDNMLGCDYAGTVSEVGASAPGNWKKGDRVAGFVAGGLYDDVGTFAEYVKIDGDLAWKVPDGLKDEEACTYGCAAVTAFLGLAVNLGISIPFNTEPQIVNNGKTILIYSGASSVGLFAIQLARKAGYTVVATASPHSFDLVKRYGADDVFDYHSKTAADEITKAHPNITQALDCFSAGASTEFCARVIKSKGGKVITVFDMGKSKTKGVEYESLIVYTVFGQPFAVLPPIGPKFPASAFNRDAFAKFYAGLPSSLGAIKAPPTRFLGKGFEQINFGLNEMRQGNVSGQKLVVNI